MKKILTWLFILVFTASLARAQDTATQQQLDQLSARIQVLETALAQQDKRLAALEKEIGELSDKFNTPAVNDSASRDDLKQLAAQVQEIVKKWQDDRDLILKEIEKLGKAGAVAPTGRKPKANTDATAAGGDNSTVSGGPQKGYYYQVKDGDTLSSIAKAYRDSDQHVKVTTAQILAANPGLDADKLYVGKKIFIPDPAAK